MPHMRTGDRPRVAAVIERYGHCVELVSMDPNFHDISVGLYVKDGTVTVWTFSSVPGVEDRIRQIRDQLVAVGGMDPVEGTRDQARHLCGDVHRRVTRFLMMQVVEKDPRFAPAEGAMAVKDLRSDLTLRAEGREEGGRWVYTLDADGDDKLKGRRLLAVTSGLVRYGEMEKVGENRVVFQCGYRHDLLVRVLLPYARNVGGVQDLLEAAALRGQMTTSTLGFTPPA